MSMPHTLCAKTAIGMRPAKHLLVAIWFGVAVGIAELMVLAVRKFVFQEMLFVGPQVVWMAPLSYLLFFVAGGLVLQAAAWRWPKLVPLHAVVFLFSFASAFSFLFLWHPRVHKVAIMVLALGVAVQAWRLSARRGEWVERLMKRTAVWMVVAVAMLGAGVHGWGAVVERRAEASIGPARAGSPNVLLIVMDTVRAESLSLYGRQRGTTPRLEELARRGVKFEWAIATAPWTAPSHASMFTGRWPHELTIGWKTPLDPSHPTLAEALRQHGYATGGFVANTRYCSYETGLTRGFTHYQDHPMSFGEIVISSSLGRLITNSPNLLQFTGCNDLLSRKTAEDINEAFLDWQSSQDGRPFFAFLNYYDAHEPYMPPSPFDTMFGPERPRGPFVHEANRGWRPDKWTLSPEELQAELDAYEGAIAYIDHQIGLLLDELERRGILDNTLIIVTADHGEQFGEHGLFGHINSLYMQLLHVPLVMSYPSGIPAGLSVSEPVSLRDLSATVMDMLKLNDQSPFPGASLARHWNLRDGIQSSEKNRLLSEIKRGFVERDFYPVAKGDMKSLVFDRYHYILNGDGSEELYDFKKDPLEQIDLAGSEEGRSLLGQFRMNLEFILAGSEVEE